MTTRTLEDRMTIIEQELERLKQSLDTENAPPSSAGWEEIFGIFADDPLFEEAVRLGREWRDAQNALTEEEPDPSADTEGVGDKA